MPKVFFSQMGLLDPEDLLTGKVILSLTPLALGLESKKRFAGQIHPGEAHYDVLCHSLETGYLANRLVDRGYPEVLDQVCPEEVAFFRMAVRLTGFLHDATEAIMSDVAAPIKQSSWFAQYRDVEACLSIAYFRHYLPVLFREGSETMGRLWGRVADVVHRADRIRLCLEASRLLPEEAYKNVIDSVADDWTIKATLDDLVWHCQNQRNPVKWGLCWKPIQMFEEEVPRLRVAIEIAGEKLIAKETEGGLK